ISKSLDSIPLLKTDNIQRKLTFRYDAKSQLLVFNLAYGRFQNVTLPATASPASYRQWLLDCQSRRLWREGYSSQAKKTSQGTGGSLLEFQIPFEVPRAVKSIMGEGGAGLKVNGYRKISFSGSSQWSDQTSIATQKQSKFPSLNMEQQSSFTISGNIGSKIFVDVNQDSKRQQSLANRIQLRYRGDEDDIVKSVELGNTNLSLPGTRFTGYSRQIQGLFGVKTTAELGGLKLTAIASQEKSSNQGASFKAGTESQTRVIRDNQFLDMTYFYLARRDSVSEDDLMPGDSITELDLYFSVSDYDGNYTNDKHPCRLFVDPFDITNSRYANENVQGTFVSFTKNSSYSNFYLHPTDHYVIMSQPITNLSIGAYIKYRRWTDATHTVFVDKEIGSRPDNSTYTLKLIANANPLPEFVTWNYVWRNVYSLGGRIDDPDNLQVVIYIGFATNATDRNISDLDNQQGPSYINLLGLDGDGNGYIDSRNEQIVDLTRGHVRFPGREPFADNTVLSDPVTTLYHTKSTTDRANGSKYYLLVNSTSRQSEFYLGHPDIVSESETVTLNGKQLTKGVDYQIYYDLGRISFLNQAALDPGADVKVDYEYAPLIAAEKKTLLGARAEYQLGSNLKLGSTVLYKSEKTTDRKPRLGEEQTKSLNLDGDISYSFQSNLLTQMVDALPFVETKAPSQISFNGEVARSIPNSNASGEAYVDDFEGAREQFSLGVTREGWHFASIPEQKQSPLTKPGRFIWYNPYDQIAVTDIYDREVRAGEDHTNVLVMRLNPSGSDRKSSWGGVMKAFSKGSYDQSKVQFIELRMRGAVGVLHIDLGEITEDLPDSNGQTNGELDTEDRDKNGILDFNEDTGLDLMPDSVEQRECNCTDPDPHGDDWAYDSRNPYNYERINGTEGNGKDPGTNGRPDSEDLNGNGVIDLRNNYYSYSIDLARGENVVPNSERNGWYTVRIPFAGAYVKDSIGLPSRANITGVRLWIDGADADTVAYIEIADLKLARNIWEVQATLPTTAVRGDSAGLTASVVNTEENEDYYSPPGVAGFYDQINNLQEKEQSLSLNYRELLPGDTAYAEKIPYKVQDLTSYQKLAMWVHGDSIRDSVEFFFRFGPDASNYYEYRTTI
ncbi:MAG: cell surface protein SprA, partial [Candidatus Zixiibacteriota bacterium]